MFSIFETMPKAELHLHLDGSIRSVTALKIMKNDRRLAILLKFLYQRNQEAWLQNSRLKELIALINDDIFSDKTSQNNRNFKNSAKDKITQKKSTSDLYHPNEDKIQKAFQHLTLQEYFIINDQIENALCLRSIEINQELLLSYFELPCLILQSAYALKEAVKDLVRQKAADNVKYCEIRWAPLIHVNENLSVAEIVKNVCESGLKEAELNLIQVRFIICALKHHSESENLNMLLECEEKIGKENLKKLAVVGVDLAGYEEGFEDYRTQNAFFEKAKNLELNLTFHGGETFTTLNQLKEGLHLIKPHRLSHGSTLCGQKDIIELIKKHNISLDLCPTSNIQCSLWPDYKHFPLDLLLEQGFPCTLSTDDPSLSDIKLSDEYKRLFQTGKYSFEDLWQLNLNGLRHAFISDSLKQKLIDNFNNELKSIINPF